MTATETATRLAEIIAEMKSSEEHFAAIRAQAEELLAEIMESS